MLVHNAGGAAARPFETHFNALDEDLKEDLLRELKSELQISKPVIFVSHNKEEVNELCDFKYKIKQGEIVWCASSVQLI